MRILYIHQYFATPKGRTGTRSYEFARRWVKLGHRVTMLTSVAQLTEAELGPRPWGRVVRRDIEGMEVIALNVPYHQTMGFARRIWSFVVFMMSACRQVWGHRRADVVFATSTPLTVGVPALFGRWVCGLPYVFEVRDLWPAVPVGLGIIKRPWVVWLLRKFEHAIYKRAAAIVALSSGMEKEIQRVAPEGTSVTAVPNCADTDFFRPDVDGQAIREQRGWGGKVVFIHPGAMGKVNGLDAIVRAADRLRDRRELHFVLLGEGKEKAGLKAERDRLGLDNLEILDGIPKEELAETLAACDVGLMTVAAVPVLEHNSANKFFDYLSAGKPVVMNYGGWKREVLEKVGAGMGCEQGDEECFFKHLVALGEDLDLRRDMGVRARHLAETEFSRDKLSDRVLAVMCNSAGSCNKQGNK